MTYLSPNQLKQYEDQGYISPIEVLSSSEALEAREEIELIEKKMITCKKFFIKVQNKKDLISL